MAAGGKGRGLQSVFFFPFLPSCKQCGYSLTGSDKLRKLRHWKMKATEVESDGVMPGDGNVWNLRGRNHTPTSMAGLVFET
ncbi:uncharacterized protein LOC104001655 isoform X5 [Pan troglodytes]|uniref:uncharacterized protein LOC104001655 isoform X5 n=1 Tax=Pan troglodytes TaxID=9598 RepID=UPI0030134B40